MFILPAQKGFEIRGGGGGLKGQKLFPEEWGSFGMDNLWNYSVHIERDDHYASLSITNTVIQLNNTSKTILMMIKSLHASCVSV